MSDPEDRYVVLVMAVCDLIQRSAGPVHFIRLPVSVTLSQTCVIVVVFPVDSLC